MGGNVHIYAQHGWGKSDKIEAGLRAGHLSGVILSPRDEQPNRMADLVDDLRDEFGEEITILFDPQFYATTVVPARDGRLPDYSYYEPGLARGRFIAQADIQRYVENTLAYQTTLRLDRVIAPSVLFGDFRDPWSQIALSLAEEAIVVHAGLGSAPPLLVSLVIDESALRSRDALNEFLDIITVWDLAGVYVVVRCNDPNYPALLEETSLANLMYLVYVLAKVNGLEVVCGYSDLVGLLLHAVGAKATGTGWFNSLRQFSLARFQPTTGGQQPRARYTSTPLLNSILVLPELEACHQVGAIGQVLSTTSYDGVMASGNPANSPWPLEVACLHHWEVLHDVAQLVSSQLSVAENLAVLEDRVRQAVATYRLLEGAGVVFEPSTGPRNLALWLRGIASFRADAGI
jgi:hypothetical protein